MLEIFKFSYALWVWINLFLFFDSLWNTVKQFNVHSLEKEAGEFEFSNWRLVLMEYLLNKIPLNPKLAIHLKKIL